MSITVISPTSIILSAEASTTPVADDSENAGSVQTGKRYAFFTLPTTEKYYKITGIEWKNGTVVGGNVFAGVEYVDASPPVLANTLRAASMQPIAQSGTNAVQRGSVISSEIIASGTTLGVYFISDSATAKFRFLANQSSSNRLKAAVSGTVDYSNGDSTAWTSNGSPFYLKVYYRGIR